MGGNGHKRVSTSIRIQTCINDNVWTLTWAYPIILTKDKVDRKKKGGGVTASVKLSSNYFKMKMFNNDYLLPMGIMNTRKIKRWE